MSRSATGGRETLQAARPQAVEAGRTSQRCRVGGTPPYSASIPNRRSKAKSGKGGGTPLPLRHSTRPNGPSVPVAPDLDHPGW